LGWVEVRNPTVFFSGLTQQKKRLFVYALNPLLLRLCFFVQFVNSDRSSVLDQRYQLTSAGGLTIVCMILINKAFGRIGNVRSDYGRRQGYAVLAAQQGRHAQAAA
jgi:hypothetical protein